MKLVCGVGINDAGYAVTAWETVGGKSKRRWSCPFHKTWRSMLERCYSAKRQARFPTYIGCSVCDEWLVFTTFRLWMEAQDWRGKQLDKDILIYGNKVYGPDACVFVDNKTNIFIIDCGAARGEWPIGVHFDKSMGKLRAMCRNPFTRKNEGLGYFTDQESAHEAWRKRKYELALLLAGRQSDERVAASLIERFNRRSA